MFSNDELDLIAAALMQHDHHLLNLAQTVPGLAQSGAADAARGQTFTLLAKVRRLKIAEEKRLAAEKAAAAVKPPTE